MANPLPDEKELYEKIEKEKLTIPQCIWQLLNHHLGNDLYVILLIAGSYVRGEPKETIPVEAGEKIIQRVEEIRVFLNKIRKLTYHK